MKTINDYKYSQRAVAPIIATLLMVAISVVGGILIFVFAQGFFTDTTIQTPNIESLEIFGYDARDVTDLQAHNAFDTDADGIIETGEGLMAAVGGTVNGHLGDSDGFAIYVRNKGAGSVTIDTIKVYGSNYVWEAGGGALSAAAPADRKFAISLTGGVAAADVADSPVLGAGQEATIIIAYDGDTNGKIKIGRPIPVVIITGSGATFSKQVQNGVQRG